MEPVIENTATRKTGNSTSKEEIEEFIFKAVDGSVQQAFEEYVRQNGLRVKEMALMERVIRVEEELKALREISEKKFEASEKRFESLQREMIVRFEAMDKRFEAMDKRFEALQREMAARFEAVDKRFEAVDKRFEAVDMRFEALQREMDARFGAMDKRFTTIQWMIGIFVGIPALFIAISRAVELFF